MRCAVISSLVMCYCAGAAPGAVLSYPTSMPIPTTQTDWTGSLAFTQFNPALGTLNSVTIELASSWSTVLTVTNSSLLPSSGSAKTELQVTVQDAGNNLISPELDSNSPSFSYALDAGAAVTSGTLAKSSSSSDLYTLPAVLSEFTGSGTIILPASTYTQTWLMNTGGNTYATQDTSARLSGTVIYGYTAVPEPAALLPLALGSLLLSRRRKA